MVTLETLELFRHLAPEEVAALSRIAQEVSFPAGQDIFREGDPGDGLFVVKSGRVEIFGHVGHEIRQIFSRVGPGGVFGEMAVIEDLPRSAFATATQPTTAYFLPREETAALIQRSPRLAAALLQLVSHRLRQFDQHYLREVVQAERLAAVGHFARSIVHDLKNPLSIINLTADTLGNPDTPPPVRASAQSRIHKQIERINDLITDILEFTQGKQSPNRAPVNAATFIEQIAAELRPELERRSIRLKLAEAIPSVVVNVDAKRLRRVFFNLAHNAMEAMPDEGTLTFRCRQEAQELITEIADSGPGIATEMADRLFQPFATHGKAHGSGLGLSICRKIIEDHGGRIWAANDPNGGAVFSFTLPVAGQ
jgi:signal transduction histidine kinase